MSDRSAPAGFNAHLEFFDADGDGAISLRETLAGLDRIGLGYALSVPGTAMIHLGVAGLGLAQRNLQNPLRLTLPKVGLLRHPDTNVVDARDAFETERLDAVFRQYGFQFAGAALTMPEIVRMASTRLLTSIEGPSDILLLPAGIGGTFIEWAALAWLCGERREGRWVLTRDAVTRFYTDPKFFDGVAARVERERYARRRSWSGKLRNALQTWAF